MIFERLTCSLNDLQFSRLQFFWNVCQIEKKILSNLAEWHFADLIILIGFYFLIFFFRNEVILVFNQIKPFRTIGRWMECMGRNHLHLLGQPIRRGGQEYLLLGSHQLSRKKIIDLTFFLGPCFKRQPSSIYISICVSYPSWTRCFRVQPTSWFHFRFCRTICTIQCSHGSCHGFRGSSRQRWPWWRRRRSWRISSPLLLVGH